MTKTYKISINVKAANELELEEKMQAFEDMQTYLSHEDMLAAVDVLMDHPNIVPFIKRVAPKEGEKLTGMRLMKIASEAAKEFS